MRPRTAPVPEPFTCPTRDTNPFLSDAEYIQSLLDALLRCVMETFYQAPKSYILRYIHQQGSVKEKQITQHLHLTPKLVHQNLEDLRRDRLIIREDFGQRSAGSNANQDSADLSYRLDILAIVDLTKYRLCKMRLAIEEDEQQRIEKSMNYKCQQCLTEYTPAVVLNFFDARKEMVICPECSGVVCENDLTDRSTSEEERIIPMRLFNQQMTPLYDILQNIDQIGTEEVLQRYLSNKHSSEQSRLSSAAMRLQNEKIKIIVERDEPVSAVSTGLSLVDSLVLQRQKKIDIANKRGLPPWFTRPIFPADELRVDPVPEDDLQCALDRAAVQHAAKLQEIRQLLQRESKSSSRAEPVLTTIEDCHGCSPRSPLS